jgi:hypothetical protein
MIPKTLYLYWGGRKLSWLRYLTVVSFAKLNPDWKIVVYYPLRPTLVQIWDTGEQSGAYDGFDYFPRLEKFAELRSFDLRVVGMSNDMPEVHKSDIFRLWALREFGGLYADFDILFAKSMPDISKKKKLYHCDGGFSIGLIAAERGDKTMDYLLDEVPKRSYVTGYQSYGTLLWNTMLDGVKLDGWNIPANFVYPVTDVERLFTKEGKLPPDSVGAHWYAGSKVAGEYENLLRPTNYLKHPSTMTKLIKGIL